IISSMTNGAAPGTGSKLLVEQATKMFNGQIPDYVSQYALSQQRAIFGSYAHGNKDIIPSSIFAAVFALIGLLHLFIFIKNYSRAHKFYYSLALFFYSLLRFLGFLLRAIWANDTLKVEIGLASSILIVIPSIILAALNLAFSQRIFTWRHPKVGSSKPFWTLMLSIYTIVIGIVVMAIVADSVIVLYYLSEKHFTMCKNVARVASLFAVLFSCSASILIALAYIYKPGTSNQNFLIYQPWWIESFNLNYFVKKNSILQAEKVFINNPNFDFKKNVVRVIPSSLHHYTKIEDAAGMPDLGLEESPVLKHNHSIFLITLTTILLLISSIFRCVSCFIDQKVGNQSWIFRPVVMYIMFGVLEVIVNVLYILWRIDLRFYKPDRLPKSV
ncbi:DUF3112 domain-containing protein ASCRUDRAFT_25019, partial [Ascoidea rubescens DSM 1968]